MAGAPRYKVYDKDGTYQAACKEIGPAGVVVAFYGDGATIRDGHKPGDTIWIQGENGNGDAIEAHDILRVKSVMGRYLS